jgi:hypothetical protein
MKMNNSSVVVVADTSGLMALLVATDANHHKALTLSTVFDKSPGAVIIPSHVFSELMNVVGKKLGHQVKSRQQLRNIWAEPRLAENLTARCSG